MGEVESFPCKIVTYEEMAKWTLDVARQIQDCRCKPTVIIGLTRGGWIPARLLCDHLHVKKLYAIKTEHWGITANQDGKALLTQELNVKIANESVLVVDDITDSGESLKLAISHIEKLKPKEIKTATLLHITHSTIEPNFYSVKVPKDKWTWFIFPWNLHEDLRTLIPKSFLGGKTEDEIRNAFKESFGIELSEDIVRHTMKELEEMGVVHRSGRAWEKIADPSS